MTVSRDPDQTDGEIEDFDRNGRLPAHVDETVRHRPPVVRKTLSYQMLWLIGGISVALVGGVISGRLGMNDAKELASAIIAPLVAVFGTMVGFFFGQSSSD